MRRDFSRFQNFVIGVLVLSGSVVTPARVVGDDLKRITEAWDRRRQQTSAFLYEVEGLTITPKGAFAGEPEFAGRVVPPEDHTGPLKLRYLVDLEKNWIRKDKEYQSLFVDLTFVTCFESLLYDGRSAQFFHPKERNFVPADVSHFDLSMNIERPGRFFDFFDFPVLLSHGITLLNSDPNPPNFKKMARVNERIRSKGQAMVGKTECHVVALLEDALEYEYFVDMEKAGAVLRANLFSKGRLHSRLDIDYQTIPWGLVPSGWSWTYFNGDLTPFRSQRVLTKNVAINPTFDKKEFQIDKRPGMIVRDAGNEKTYVVDSSGSLVPKKASRNAPLGLLIGIGVIVCVAIAALLVWTRRRQST